MFRIGQRIEYIYTEAMETRFLFPCRNHGSFIKNMMTDFFLTIIFYKKEIMRKIETRKRILKAI